MLKIKLLPRGKKHQITYRIVVAECRSKSNGKFIDDLGFYTPQTKEIKIDKEKLAQWQKNGAQLTTGVDKLFNPEKYPNKKKNKKGQENSEVSEVKEKKEIKPSKESTPKTEEKTKEEKIVKEEDKKETEVKKEK